MKKLVWPVYEFRPLPGGFAGDVLRYADGKWIPDDGEYDIAFIGDWRSGEGWSFPACLMFEPPYQKNIICSWLTTHWTGAVKEHPRGNPWHYALREGKKEWGGDWGRDSHPNYAAGRSGMSERASRGGCSNGVHIEFHPDDKHIAAGLLRERETKKIFEWPTGMRCIYCGAESPLKFSAEAV